MKTRAWREALLLAAFALPPATVSYTLVSRAEAAAAVAPLAPLHLRVDDALKLTSEDGTDALWIDARPARVFATEHVPGAINLPPDDWEARFPALLQAWVPGQPLLVYCSSASCDASEQVASRLRRELGQNEVWVLEGGWEAWKARSQP